MKIKSSIDISEGSANLGEAMNRPSDEISKVSEFRATYQRQHVSTSNNDNNENVQEGQTVVPCSVAIDFVSQLTHQSRLFVCLSSTTSCAPRHFSFQIYFLSFSPFLDILFASYFLIFPIDRWRFSLSFFLSSPTAHVTTPFNARLRIRRRYSAVDRFFQIGL